MSFTLVYHAPVIHRIHKTICPVNASSPQVPPVLPVFLRHSSPVTPKKPINTKVYRFFQQPLFSCPAPRVGLEPTTPRLTAVCSTTDMNTYRKTRISKSLSHLLSDETYIILNYSRNNSINCWNLHSYCILIDYCFSPFKWIEKDLYLW